jgi:ParB/RepB/Spo0J family partition protein
MNGDIEQLKIKLQELKEKKEKKKISGPERLELKKIEKKIDEFENPVEASGIFVPDSAIKKDKVKITSIISSDYYDRSNINREKLEKLKKSIKRVGLLQRINVLDMEDGTYKKVNGGRRILAYEELGKEEIEAKIWDKRTDPYVIKLAILHENIVREDLSIYDKVRLTYDFLKEVLNLNTNEEVKGILTKIKNKNKLKKVNDELLEKEILINKTLEEIKIFSSISRVLNVSSVLKMSDKIIDYINIYNLDHSMAELLTKYEHEKFKDIKFDNIVELIVKDEMSLKDATVFIKSHLSEKEKETIKKDSLTTHINNIKKSSNKLEANKRKELEIDLENIFKKYFK